MKSSFERSAGLALMVGTLLLVVTMVLHPAGGTLERLIKTARVIVISHSIALLAIPFLAVGYWGLTKRIGTDNFFSIIAFSTILCGLIAGMVAAAINGLALPIYIQNYHDASLNVAESIRPLLKSSLAINHAFDFIFIGATCLSTLFWSVAIMFTKKIPVWVGYLGIALFALAVVMLAFGFVFVDLHGFRMFILGNVIWTIQVARVLINTNQPDHSFQQ